MMLIVAFSWSVFWLSPQDLAVRLKLCIIFMLTIMAFSLGFTDHIPEISYLTFLDTVFISMLLFIFCRVLKASFPIIFVKKAMNLLLWHWIVTVVYWHPFLF